PNPNTNSYTYTYTNSNSYPNSYPNTDTNTYPNTDTNCYADSDSDTNSDARKPAAGRECWFCECWSCSGHCIVRPCALERFCHRRWFSESARSVDIRLDSCEWARHGDFCQCQCCQHDGDIFQRWQLYPAADSE